TSNRMSRSSVTSSIAPSILHLANSEAASNKAEKSKRPPATRYCLASSASCCCRLIHSRSDVGASCATRALPSAEFSKAGGSSRKESNSSTRDELCLRGWGGMLTDGSAKSAASYWLLAASSDRRLFNDPIPR